MRPSPSLNAQRAMLARLRAGLVLAGPDNRVLRCLERQRHARARALHNARTGRPTKARAWTRAKAGEVVRRLVALVTGGEIRGARADRARAAAEWVHPLLRFAPAEPITDNDDAAAVSAERVVGS